MNPDKSLIKEANARITTRFELLTIEELTKLDESTAKAKEEGKLQQRHSMDAVIRKYAQDMLNGDWQLNPQPLIITTEGWLLDGWHRVKAAIRAGMPLMANVTREWPAHGVFKVVDTGKGRTVCQLLKMEGVKNISIRTGIVNTLVGIACNSLHGAGGRRALSRSEYDRVEDLFGHSMDELIRVYNSTHNRVPSPVMGSMIFVHEKLGEPIQAFAEDLINMNFNETHPARALKRWLENNTNRDIRASGIRITMNCLFSYTEKLPMTKANPSNVGLEWARKLQSKRVEEVKAIVGAR